MDNCSPKVQVICDKLEINGGMELVTLKLAENLSAKVISGFVNNDLLSSNVAQLEVNELLGWLPDFFRNKIISNLCLLTCFFILKFKGKNRINIYSGNFSVLAVKKYATVQNIYYCHSLPRAFFDLVDFYSRHDNFLEKIIKRAIGPIFRKLYRKSLQKMDKIFCNSQNVANQLNTYLQLPAEVLYPTWEDQNLFWETDAGYYLSIGRHETLKQIEKIIEAFRRMPNKKLIVASFGSMSDDLKRKSSDCANIEFTGYLERQDLCAFIRNCTATIYIPINEDFGLSVIESHAAGKPVIGVNQGGLKETIRNGQTGFLLEPNFSINDLTITISQLDKFAARQMRDACISNANQFSQANLISTIKSRINV